MTEMSIVPGKCLCGKKLEHRINQTDNKKHWLISGTCHKCKIVFAINVFSRSEEPIEDLDYMIDFTQKVEVSEDNKTVIEE